MHPNWKRNTILFLISQSVTLFGSTLVQMAIIWYVTLKTSSGAWVSAFTVCAYLPQFIVSFPGGVWADRYSRKRLIIAADAVIAIATLAMFFLMPHIRQDTPLLIALLVVCIVRSLGAGVQTPAVNAMLPQLVPEEQLMRYNGVNATMQSVVQFAAPVAAGALLSFATLRSALIIDVVTAAVGIGLFVGLTVPAAPGAKTQEPLLADMKKGLRYTFSDVFLKRLLPVFGLFIFLCVPAGFLATLFVSRTFGDTYWYLTAVELVGFLGMAAGGLMMSLWGGFKRRTATFLGGMAIFGLLAVAMGLAKSFILYLALMLIYGVALTAVQTASTTLVQENAEPAMQGRVFGLFGAAYSGFLPLGMAVFGPLADVVPLHIIMIGSGALLVIMAAILWLDPPFRR